ncbi:glycosyltransferase [Maribacter algarum]|uniref:Glycosyltransferase n=1 Tax=Maribacter algarum (ex Zhang et al. 2020) TaxID=2578118 RepID=A0A5S3QN03_9FLAO|nr:glycosyltransferase family 39 protein [Maribacter algarum]TMM59284.1 glycosyltransferase [Maribacter algarum]
MLNRLLDKLIPKYNDLKLRTVFGILFAISLFVRLPFFFRDYIDRDESTFILMAQSWVDGNLPYTELWDLKPPIAFLFFAVIIYLFGKSFIAIRLAGVVIVALTAFFSYRITENLAAKKTAFWVGIICVAFQSMFGSIQGVMSEHICMVFLVPAIYIMMTKKEWHWLGLAGVLMGISIMVKLNMAYTLLFVGIYLIYFFIREKKYKNGIVGATAYGLGIIGIVLLTWLPYYLSGIQELWWKSVVIAPLDYAGASQNSILNLMPTFILIGAFFFFAWKKNYLDFKNSSVRLLLIAILGILYAFYKGGRINSHYLIQLYPILVVLVGIVFSRLFATSKLKISKGFLLLLLIIPAESYLEYYRIVKHKIERGSFPNGEGITVPQYLLKNKIDTHNILFLEYHIGYWVLNEKPPTKAATHPSNICKPEMFAAYDNPRKTPMEELRFIMEDLKPNTLVRRKDRLVFDAKQTEPNAYIDTFIEKHYQLLTTVDEAEIYRRLE